MHELENRQQRAYQTIDYNLRLGLWESVFLCIIFMGITLWVLPKIALIMHNFACYMLNHMAGDPVAILTRRTQCLWAKIQTIDLTPASHSHYLPQVTLAVSLFTIWISQKINALKAFAFWISFIAIIISASSVFFILAPQHFPYTVGNFTNFYMVSEMYFWLSLPLFLSISLIPVPTSMVSKMMFLAITILYSMAFGIIRYGLFLYILAKSSYLFMPVLVFVLGPFLDLYVIISAYALYVSLFTEKRTEGLSS